MHDCCKSDCQYDSCCSCGMPLNDQTTSQHDSCYCVHCQDQSTGKLKSKAEVREGSIKAAVAKMGKTREEAEKMADTMMPQLPRWQKKEDKDNCCGCC